MTCDLSLEAFWPPVCTMWLITTVQIHQVICPTPLGEKTSWQPVSCVLSLEWSHCSPAPNIRARHPEVLRVPYSQKDAHSLQYKKKKKKTSSLGKTAIAYTCISNHPWRTIHSRRWKIDTSQDSVCLFFSWKAEPVFCYF